MARKHHAIQNLTVFMIGHTIECIPRGARNAEKVFREKTTYTRRTDS